MRSQHIRNAVLVSPVAMFVGTTTNVMRAQEHHEPEKTHNDRGAAHSNDHHEATPARGKMESNLRPEDRNAMAGHFKGDLQRLRAHPELRHNIVRGGQLPVDFRSGLRPVPAEYIGHMAPPPAGYVYGYYDGYVVSYNPTTRIVADTLDLIAAALH